MFGFIRTRGLLDKEDKDATAKNASRILVPKHGEAMGETYRPLAINLCIRTQSCTEPFCEVGGHQQS